MPFHICPVCGKRHEIHEILDRLSYGLQRTCSPRCKRIFPSMIRSRILAEIAKDTQYGGHRKARSETC